MHDVDTAKMGSLKSQFEKLPDPRSTINRRHPLGEICVIAVAAIIAGADGPTDINRWAKLKGEWLITFLTLPFGVPSKDCFARVDSILFQECFLTGVRLVLCKNG